MLLGGEQLLKADYQNYPKSLPLLAVHGTADKVVIFAVIIFLARSNFNIYLLCILLLTFSILSPADNLPQGN